MAKKFLIPVDGSVSSMKAADTGLYYAKQCGADVLFLYVASDINKDIPSELVFEEVFKKVPAGVKAARQVGSGGVAAEILRVAEEAKADLVVVGSRGLGIFRGAIIGSVSQKLVEEAKVPVLVVK